MIDRPILARKLGAVHEPLQKRWSARGYDASATIADTDLIEIIEAGRWAPTWGRVQPVRFIAGRRGDATFTGLADSLTRGNRPWAPNAAALILVCTRQLADDESATTYAAVDAGLAVGQMIVQAVADGYNAHPLAGFSVPDVIERFAIPADQRPLVILAVGVLADPSTLPAEIAERDLAPRDRLPLRDITFADSWGRPFA